MSFRFSGRKGSSGTSGGIRGRRGRGPENPLSERTYGLESDALLGSGPALTDSIRKRIQSVPTPCGTRSRRGLIGWTLSGKRMAYREHDYLLPTIRRSATAIHQVIPFLTGHWWSCPC